MNEAKELNFVEKFFGNTLNNFVKRFKYVIMFIMACWTIVATIFATKLSPLSKQENFVPSDHPMEID